MSKDIQILNNWEADKKKEIQIDINTLYRISVISTKKIIPFKKSIKK